MMGIGTVYAKVTECRISTGASGGKRYGMQNKYYVGAICGNSRGMIGGSNLKPETSPKK